MFRSMMLAFAVACLGAGAAAADPGAATNTGGGGFNCQNKASIAGVECIGSIAVLPINIDVHDVGVLNGNDLDILNNDLNHLSVLDGNILDNNKILNDAEVTVLQDFLNKFAVDVTKNDIDVCTTVLGLLLCK
jgi:hypothetical protein